MAIKRKLLLSILCSFMGWNLAGAQENLAPRLDKKKGNWELMVDGKPYLMLAGELHNSSTGSAHHMRSIWKRMAQKNLNTVIAAVSWELTEPEEGKFDFSLVDEMIRGAREANLRLVLLWFGSWKNGASTYVPGWVKRNPKRFPLAHFKGGEPTNTLSALGKNSMEADTRAFTALMKHLKQVDSQPYTVDAPQMELIKTNVSNYFAVNEKVMQSAANGDELDAFSGPCVIIRHWPTRLLKATCHGNCFNI